jgi:hypothetical protein
MLPLNKGRLRQANVAPMASKGWAPDWRSYCAEPVDSAPRRASAANGWLLPYRSQAQFGSLE